MNDAIAGQGQRGGRLSGLHEAERVKTEVSDGPEADHRRHRGVDRERRGHGDRRTRSEAGKRAVGAGHERIAEGDRGRRRQVAGAGGVSAGEGETAGDGVGLGGQTESNGQCKCECIFDFHIYHRILD